MSKKKKWDVEDINLDKVKAKEKKKAPGWDFKYTVADPVTSVGNVWGTYSTQSVGVEIDPATGRWVPVNR